MLKTVAISANSKTGPIAVTYRSGEHQTYGTCPKSCALHPKSETGTDKIDPEYMAALVDAVPRGGMAWTYSHFPAALLPMPKDGKTVINASCDSTAEAVDVVLRLKRPAVYAAPVDTVWPQKIDGVTFARCPADMAEDFTCQKCGDGSPLCARGDRNFVVVFVAHGTGKKRVGSDEGGGCYAASGPTAIQWHATRTKGRANDAEAILEFSAGLPRGTMLRHHVAGDMGWELTQC